MKLGDYDAAIASLERALDIEDDEENGQLYQSAIDASLSRSSKL